MADIQLRFGKDMLVIGGSVQAQLALVQERVDADLDGEGAIEVVVADARAEAAEATGNTGMAAVGMAEEQGASGDAGVDGGVNAGGLERFAGVSFVDPAHPAAFDTELALILEPEVFEDAFTLEKAAGAQCLVAPTADLTPARLAHVGMRDAAEDLARTAFEVTAARSPEHILVEIAPCGLPLDPASKASLLENRLQYERAARLFDGADFDAFFLNGFTRVADLKCALMGIRKVSDAPILASVDVDGEGMLRSLEHEVHPSLACESLEDAVSVMAEYGAQVVGFCTDGEPEVAAALAARVASVAYLPMLVQLFVRPCDADEGAEAVGAGSCLRPDDAYDAALALMAAGAQFVRAAGSATPAYTGAMAAAVAGLDVKGAVAGGSADGVHASQASLASSDLSLEELSVHLRQSVNGALGIGGAE